MSALEDRIRRELHRAVLESPMALEALATGETVEGDIGVLIRDVMLPLLLAQSDALVEVARAVDDLRERVTDLEGRPGHGCQSGGAPPTPGPTVLPASVGASSAEGPGGGTALVSKVAQTDL